MATWDVEQAFADAGCKWQVFYLQVVSDDGPGIASELQSRIFDNGFSTKGTEHGIGLSLVRQSLESIGGNIEFDSEAGVFTQFFINLPYNITPNDIPSNNISAVNHD